ncbi:MAG: hypothetical protein DCC67_06570 [Planctomycetota bacterium]|nr:MAG: hypothetical protein DCC67_06570 [Planctomycetota bacterium]
MDGPEKTVQHLREALKKRELAPEDFSLRDLAEALTPAGRQWVASLDPRRGGVSVMESTEGVDVTAFLNVAGQVIYAKILDAYTQEAFVASRLVQTIPTRLDGEKIPGVTRVADEIDVVEPGMPFPHLGFGETYIETPGTAKRGFIVPVTKEAIFFDRTHLVLSRAAEVGEILGLNKEKRLLDLVIGVTNNYKQNGVTYNTYNATGTPWKNVLAANELVDWTDVDAAEQLFAEMLDPSTGEPVLVRGTTVLVMPAYRHAAHRVFNAAEITYAGGGAATATTAANPLGNYRVLESRLAYRRIVASGVAAADAKKWWFIGDFRKAFAYMENWPITVTQAPLGSEAEFASDVVLRFKASERGAAAVINPRYVVKCTG